MGITAAFGHAIHLQHIQAQALIPAQQCLRHRRRTGQRNAQGIQAQAGKHLVPHALADKGQVAARYRGVSPGPCVDAHLKFGPNPRHTEQRRRPRPAQVCQKVSRLSRKTPFARYRSQPSPQTSAPPHDTAASRTAADPPRPSQTTQCPASAKPRAPKLCITPLGKPVVPEV
jgi:hypothetical protein